MIRDLGDAHISDMSDILFSIKKDQQGWGGKHPMLASNFRVIRDVDFDELYQGKFFMQHCLYFGFEDMADAAVGR